MEALGISLNGIIAYIVNFALLVVLLRIFLYKPVKNALAQRQQRIAESLEAADKAAQEAAQQRAEFEKELAQARQVAQVEPCPVLGFGYGGRGLQDFNQIVRPRQVLESFNESGFCPSVIVN